MINRSIFLSCIFFILMCIFFFFSCTPIQYLNDLESLIEQTPQPDSTPTLSPETTPAPTSEATPEPTPESTLTPIPTPTLTPTPIPAHMIYDDSLVNDWEDWSWSCTNYPNCIYPVYNGSNSLEVTYNEIYAGLYFHNAQGDIQTINYTNLNFFVHGGYWGGQSIQIFLRDSSDVQVGIPVSVDDYVSGGSISPDKWEEVQIPLADFNASDELIRKVIFQYTTGVPFTTLYLDLVKFY